MAFGAVEESVLFIEVYLISGVQIRKVCSTVCLMLSSAVVVQKDVSNL